MVHGLWPLLSLQSFTELWEHLSSFPTPRCLGVSILGNNTQSLQFKVLSHVEEDQPVTAMLVITEWVFEIQNDRTRRLSSRPAVTTIVPLLTDTLYESSQCQSDAVQAVPSTLPSSRWKSQHQRWRQSLSDCEASPAFGSVSAGLAVLCVVATGLIVIYILHVWRTLRVESNPTVVTHAGVRSSSVS